MEENPTPTPTPNPAPNPGAGDNPKPNPPPVADLRTIIDEKGNFQQGWTEKLGGNDDLAKKYTSLESLVRGHVNLQTIVGRKGVVLPNENSTDQEWSDFYTKLGRPENPDGYDIRKPDGVPDALWDAKRTEGFKGLAHKLGLTPKQVSEIVSWETSNAKAALDDHTSKTQATVANAEESLKKEWGVLYEKKMGGALRMAEMLDPTLVQDPTLANSPAFIKAMAKVAAMVSETPLMGARGGDASMSVRQRLDAIRGDKNDPYYNKSHPGHAARVTEVTMLMQQLS